MGILPPHLTDEAEEETIYFPVKSNPKIGRQGPSKYGKGGSRIHKAKGRKSHGK